MHYYVSNTSKKIIIIFYIAILSLLINTFLKYLLTSILPNVSFTITPFAIFMLIYFLYDKYLWKLPYLSDVPDFNGEWKGELKSSFDNFEKSLLISSTITQTSSKILVKFATEESSSESVNLSIINKETGSYEIVYNYQNIPTANSPGTMHIHRGTVWLEYLSKDKTNTLTGQYFTDSQRGGNYGIVSLEKQ